MNNKLRQGRSDVPFDIAVALILLFTTLIVAYPLYFIAIASFSDPDAVNAGRVFLYPRGITLLGYQMVFGDMRIWRGYLNTLIYTAGYTAIASSVTLMAGYALSRKELFGRGVIHFVFLFTLYFSGGLIPTYLVMQKLHLTANPLIMLLMNSLSVFYVFVCRTFFETNLSEELYEAARIDGCGNWTFFLRIALPLSKAVAAVMVIYYAVNQWNSYFTALIYLNDMRQYPLQIILRELLIQSQQLQTSIEVVGEFEKLAGLVKYVVIIVSAAPMLILYPFMQRFFVQGVMIGSVKG